MTDDQEIECRFRLTPELKDKLLSLDTLGGFFRSRVEYRDIRDVYLDTGEKHLLDAGAMYRLRDQTGSESVLLLGYKQTKKLEGAKATMIQVEVPLEPHRRHDFIRDRIDSEPTRMARALIGNKPFALAFLVANRRTAIWFKNQEYAGMIEVALDDLIYHGPDLKTVDDAEIECECKGVPSEAFDSFVSELQRRYDLQPSVGNKYQRAMQKVYGIPISGIGGAR